MLLNSHNRRDTPVLVIDFDHREIKKKTDESKDEEKKREKRQTVVRPDISLCSIWLTTHQGTPIFMARSVVKGRPNTREAWARGLPRLERPALAVYSTLLPDRLKEFPQPQKNQVRRRLKIPDETHELRHDAESVFWLLVWWAIHLRPTSSPSSMIDSKLFGALTNVNLAKGYDFRTMFLQTLDEGLPWLDPSYMELEPLFKQMATQLTGDLHWAGSVQMKDPEFLHEALQRIIFNFLLMNKAKSFMILVKDLNHDREVEDQIRQHAHKQFTPTKRSHCTMEGGSETRVRHLSSVGLVYTLILVGVEAH